MPEKTPSENLGDERDKKQFKEIWESFKTSPKDEENQPTGLKEELIRLGAEQFYKKPLEPLSPKEPDEKMGDN